jgi:hypothetical protein
MLPSGQDVKDAAMMAGAGFGSFVPETAHAIGMAKDVLSGKRPDFDAKTPYGYEEMVERAKHAGEISENPSAGAQLIGAGSQFLTDPVNIASALKAGAGAKLAMAGISAKAGEAERALEIAKAPRSDLGFYSHGAETAANLPQAKGTPEQMRAMLEKNGVKPAELEGYEEKFAGRPSVTKEELAQHFRERMPQVEEKVRGSKINKYPYRDADEWQLAISRAERSRNFDEAERLTLAWEEAEGHGGENAPKYQRWSLPGGENYREVLLKLPMERNLPEGFKVVENPIKSPTSKKYIVADETGWRYGSGNTETEAIDNYSKNHSPNKFVSSHWDDPNVLAHVRMSDRTGPNGEKLLHVEELQSDWGQKGKKEGFDKPKVDLKPFEANLELARMASVRLGQNMIERESGGKFNNFSEILDSGDADLVNRIRAAKKTDSELIAAHEAYQAADRALQEARAGNRSVVPTAPYVTSTQGWTDLALKRVMKEAAEGGYEGVVFTPGAEQAKRYDLSKQIGALHLEDGPRGEQMLRAYGPSGDHIINKHIIDAEKELPDLVGKEAAEKLLSQTPAPASGNQGPTRSLTGLDLQTGGEGMKGYYDKIVPTQLQKLVKQHDKDAKLGHMEIPDTAPMKGGSAYDVMNFLPETRNMTEAQQDKYWSSLENDERKQLFNRYFEETGATKNITGLHLPITDKMRQSILSGQKAFARGGEIEPVNVNHALNLSHQFGPAAAQDAVSTAKQLARGRP